MSVSKLSVEEVEERIKEAMRAKKIEARELIKTHSNIFTGITGYSREADDKLNQLDIEIRNNNLKWNVTTEKNIISRRKFYGKLIVFSKKLIRKFLRWYINPPVDQQREFNGSVTRSINLLGNFVHTFIDNNRQIKESIAQLERNIESIDERIARLWNSRIKENESQIAELKEALESRIEASEAQIAGLKEALESRVEANEAQIAGLKEALESNWKNTQNILEETRNQLLRQIQLELTIGADRLRRIERKISKGIGVDINTSIIDKLINQDKQQFPDIDYFLFEQRYRGSREEIKERQKVYINYFKGKNNVLDIGCGRGEFIELLIENGIGVSGIDINEDMVNYCQDRGLPVIKSDLFDYLNSLNDNNLDGIFSAQVIEHLTPESLPQLIALTYSKLKPTGILVLETINPQNLLAVANWFYMDLSHIRPVHPLTIQFILETEGFKEIQLVYSNPSTGSMIPNLRIEGDKDNNVNEFNQAIDRLNWMLFGPQDYAIIGKK